MRNEIPKEIPRYTDLIVPTYKALQALDGSGNNEEILDRIIADLNLPDHVVDYPHKGSTSITELAYQAAWARTYLSKYGVITNSGRSVWAVTSEYSKGCELDGKKIVSAVVKAQHGKNDSPSNGSGTRNPLSNGDPEDDGIDVPDEVKSWRTQLADILQNMDPYGFERLTQRILRECGFSQVEVTKKSGDGGIDGTGKLKINGIFSFNVAFQCKRYSGLVGAPAIRDFRGSLTTDIEKGVLITTGTFSKAAREEATNPGKQQIDLIDGEELITKIAEYGIGVREVKTYEIDEEFFQKV